MAQISSLREIALRLGRAEDARRDAGALEREMGQVIERLRAGGDRVRSVLDEVETGGSVFEADLSAARTSFARAAEFNVRLGTVADELSALAAEADQDIALGRNFADATLHPSYTMAREREVHEDAFGLSGALLRARAA